MKKYHNELKDLARYISNNNGYYCGHCEECENIYRKFMSVIRRVKSPSEPEVLAQDLICKIKSSKVDLSKMHCFQGAING